MGLSGVVSWVKVFIHHEDTKSTKKKRRLGIAWFLEFKARFGFLIRHHERILLQL